MKLSPEDLKALDRKEYGVVKRGERVFYRNYRRELKNGKGLSFLDLCKKERKRNLKEIDELLNEKLWK